MSLPDRESTLSHGTCGTHWSQSRGVFPSSLKTLFLLQPRAFSKRWHPSSIFLPHQIARWPLYQMATPHRVQLNWLHGASWTSAPPTLSCSLNLAAPHLALSHSCSKSASEDRHTLLETVFTSRLVYQLNILQYFLHQFHALGVALS